MKNILIMALVGLMTLTIAGCEDEATVASKNLSRAADQFEINRRIVFLNGITDKYILSIEGLCSINDQKHQVEVTCKTGQGMFKKHFLGLSDNVTYFAEQLEPQKVSTFHYRVIFKPQVIVPNIDFHGNAHELKKTLKLP